MLRVLKCELYGKQCDWHEETQYGEYEYYGVGTMKQLRCPVCQTIEYVEFTSELGYVTNITTVSDEDFEALCAELENPSEPTEAFKEAMKKYKEKFGNK
jgi:hypothetical protein